MTPLSELILFILLLVVITALVNYILVNDDTHHWFLQTKQQLPLIQDIMTPFFWHFTSLLIYLILITTSLLVVLDPRALPPMFPNIAKTASDSTLESEPRNINSLRMGSFPMSGVIAILLVINCLLQVLWHWLFFQQHNLLLSFLVIILLTIETILLTLVMYTVNPWAASLMLIYVVFLILVVSLNARLLSH